MNNIHIFEILMIYTYHIHMELCHKCNSIPPDMNLNFIIALLFNIQWNP